MANKKKIILGITTSDTGQVEADEEEEKKLSLPLYLLFDYILSSLIHAASQSFFSLLRVSLSPRNSVAPGRSGLELLA